jgi:hypothetical protein
MRATEVTSAVVTAGLILLAVCLLWAVVQG